jgi:hypothetical protein
MSGVAVVIATPAFFTFELKEINGIACFPTV